MTMTKKESYELLPPEGDNKALGKKCFHILSMVIADKARQGLLERWARAYQLRRNNHWRAKSASVPLTSANMIYTHTQRTTNTMTDNNPTFNATAIGEIPPDQADVLNDLQRAAEQWWIDQEQQDVLETSVLNGEQYGPAIEKVIFNPDLEFGLGEVETINVDPYCFGWYPVKLADARNLQKCDAVLYYKATPVRQLRAQFPDLAGKIKPADEFLSELHIDERREIAGSKTEHGSLMVEISSTIQRIINFFSGEGGAEGEEETVELEMWVRDRTRVRMEDGTSQPKYTGEIRYVHLCAPDIVLEDKSNPNINPNLPDEEARKTYLYDKFPFAMVNSIKDTSSAWGMSDYEQLESLNMEVNKALSQFVLEKDRTTRKKLVNPRDSGVQNDELTNYVSVINPTSQMTATGIRWLEPPAVSTDYEKAIAMFKDLFFLISGTFDVDMAQSGGRQVIAYKAIAALIERAATMNRGKIRAYSRLIRERGRMYLSHLMNFYTEDRWIEYKDAGGKRQSKVINGSKMILPVRFSVVSGSTMPVSKIQHREEALELYKAQAIDQVELLDRMDWPNRTEIIERMLQGPLGALFQKLATAGLPEQIMGYLQQVSTADPKKLAQAIEKGEFPSFPQFMQQIMAEMQGQNAEDPAKTLEMQEKEAEALKARAEVEKIFAEKELTTAKIITEQVNQQVSLAGVEFDKQSLEIERAKLVKDIERQAADAFVSAQRNKPGYNERGIRSNNRL